MKVTDLQNIVGRLHIVGEDREGNHYQMAVKHIDYNYYEQRMEVIVHLPFSPDHRIWEELRN